jgi:hypothetical protein
MLILRSLFRTKEVKATLLALDFEERRLREAADQPMLGPYQGYKLVGADIRRAITASPDMAVGKVRDGVAPRTVVFLAIANHTAQLLRSGSTMCIAALYQCGDKAFSLCEAWQ